MSLSNCHEVARRWWTGDWKHETDFNSQVLDLIASNDGKLTNEAAQKIANKYRVARQFPKFTKTTKPKTPDEYAPVVDCINAILPDLTAETLPTLVEKVANDLSAMRVVNRDGQFQVIRNGTEGKPFTKGGGVPISAVSKWIWFARPDVGVIYDERARVSLHKDCSSVRHGDYRAYVTAFEDVYTKHAEELNRALDSLGPARPSESWASRKLLDLCLWNSSPTTKDR